LTFSHWCAHFEADIEPAKNAAYGEDGMFFFFAWGNRWNYKVKEEGLRVEKFCPECDSRGKFFEVIPTKYFTLFGIPIKATEKKKSLLECPNCHERFYIQQSDYLSAINDSAKTKEHAIHQEESTDFCILRCDNCDQKLRVPRTNKMLRITCPACKGSFNLQKGHKLKEVANDSQNKGESKIAWGRRHPVLLIRIAVIACVLSIPIVLHFWDERKTDTIAPSLPAQSATGAKPAEEYPQTKRERNERKKLKDPEGHVTEYPPLPASPSKPIPPVEPINPKRLSNGSAPFRSGIRSGHSTLTVENGTGTDAVVKAIRFKDGDEEVRKFYVQQGSRWTAPQIPSGRYVLRVAFGRDWNSKSRKFNFRRSFSETEIFDISETTSVKQTDDGQLTQTQFTEMRITLHKILMGNFKSHEINEEDFDR
jgi:Zn finger protein HypA/HybF involved in hydrogenase expression